MTCIPVRNKTYEGLKGNKLPGEISGVMSAAIVLLHTLTDATVVLKPVQMFRFSKKCCLCALETGPAEVVGSVRNFIYYKSLGNHSRDGKSDLVECKIDLGLKNTVRLS